MKELLIKIKALFEGSGANQAATAVKQVGDAADQAKAKTGGLAGAMGDGSAKAGIFAGATAALGTALLGIAQQAITACIGAIKNLVQGFAEGVVKAADFAGAMTDLSARTGQPIEELVVLKRAFENAGMGADAVGPMLNRLQKAMAGVNEEGQPTSDALAKLGLSAAKLNTMTATQQLQAVQQAILALPTPAAQAAASMEIFGRSGGQMLALFKDTSAFATAAQQVGQLGADTQKAAAALDTFSDAMGALDDKKMGFFMAAAAQFATDLERAGVAVNAIDLGPLGEQVGQVVRGFIEVEKGLVAIAGGVEPVKAAFGALWETIESMSMSFSLLVDGVKWLRDIGAAAVTTEQQQKAVEEANRRIATSAQDAAATIAAMRAESQGTTAEAVQTAVPAIQTAAASGTAQIQTTGAAAQQGIGEAGARAQQELQLTSSQLNDAVVQLAQVFMSSQSGTVAPAVQALVASVEASFQGLAAQLNASVTALQASQTAMQQQLEGIAQSSQQTAQAVQEGMAQMSQAVASGATAVSGAVQSGNAGVASAFSAAAGAIQASLANLQAQIVAVAARIR